MRCVKILMDKYGVWSATALLWVSVSVCPGIWLMVLWIRASEKEVLAAFIGGSIATLIGALLVSLTIKTWRILRHSALLNTAPLTFQHPAMVGIFYAPVIVFAVGFWMRIFMPNFWA